MKDFINYLNENFGESIEKLASSQNNPIFDFDFKMINLDKMAKQLPTLNRNYRGNEFATADALFISNTNNKFIFHFIEFKNVDYSTDKDLKMSKYLVDKYEVSLRAKQYESISLIAIYLKIFKSIDNETTKEMMSNIEKKFYLVSKTNQFLNHPYKNKSNVHMANDWSF